MILDKLFKNKKNYNSKNADEVGFEKADSSNINDQQKKSVYATEYYDIMNDIMSLDSNIKEGTTDISHRFRFDIFSTPKDNVTKTRNITKHWKFVKAIEYTKYWRTVINIGSIYSEELSVYTNEKNFYLVHTQNTEIVSGPGDHYPIICAYQEPVEIKTYDQMVLVIRYMKYDDLLPLFDEQNWKEYLNNFNLRDYRLSHKKDAAKID